MAPPSAPPHYDPFFHLVAAPYSALRVPKLRLKVPTFSWPSTMVVFGFVLLSYFLVISGFIYDVITMPPGIGGRQDPTTGKFIPEVFMSGRLNGQYIIEGLSSGFMFVLGGVGVILIDLASDKSRAKNIRTIFLATGVSFIFVAYTMSMVFLRIKVPGYLS